MHKGIIINIKRARASRGVAHVDKSLRRQVIVPEHISINPKVGGNGSAAPKVSKENTRRRLAIVDCVIADSAIVRTEHINKVLMDGLISRRVLNRMNIAILQRHVGHMNVVGKGCPARKCAAVKHQVRRIRSGVASSVGSNVKAAAIIVPRITRKGIGGGAIHADISEKRVIGSPAVNRDAARHRNILKVAANPIRDLAVNSDESPRTIGRLKAAIDIDAAAVIIDNHLRVVACGPARHGGALRIGCTRPFDADDISCGSAAFEFQLDRIGAAGDPERVASAKLPCPAAPKNPAKAGKGIIPIAAVSQPRPGSIDVKVFGLNKKNCDQLHQQKSGQ